MPSIESHNQRLKKRHPTIGNNVIIGNNCVIHPNVVLYDNITIGDNTIVHANSVIGANAFYFNKKQNTYSPLITCGEVIIGDFVEIGANNTIDAGVTDKTKIGNGTKTDYLVHITHLLKMCFSNESLKNRLPNYL